MRVTTSGRSSGRRIHLYFIVSSAVVAAGRPAPLLHLEKPLAGGSRRQLHLQRSELLEVVVPVLDERAGRVALARARAEEAELDRLAEDQAEFLCGHIGLGALFHAEGDDAQGLERWSGARDSR